MRALQKVLVDLVLDKSIQRIADALGVRVRQLFARLNFKVLLFIALFVRVSLLAGLRPVGRYRGCDPGFLSHAGSMATVGIVPVVELVRMNEGPLVFGFGVCFDELGRELAGQCLVVHRVAAFVHRGGVVSAAHSRRIFADHIVGDFVLVFYPE